MSVTLCTHYYHRYRADVMLKAAQWRAGKGLPEHVRNYNLTDSLLWSRTEDRRLRDRWGSELQRRMSALVTMRDSWECLPGRAASKTSRIFICNRWQLSRLLGLCMILTLNFRGYSHITYCFFSPSILHCGTVSGRLASALV